MQLKNIGIGQRLVAILAFLMIALVAFFLVSVSIGTKALTLSVVAGTLEQTAYSVSNTLDGWLEDRMHFLDLAASSEVIVDAAADGDWQQAETWLKEAKSRDAMLESLFVHDAKGISVVTSNAGGRGKNYASEAYSKAIFSGNFLTDSTNPSNKGLVMLSIVDSIILFQATLLSV